LRKKVQKARGNGGGRIDRGTKKGRAWTSKKGGKNNRSLKEYNGAVENPP